MRSGEDLLFQVMLDLGIELSAKIERKEIAGKEVFSVDDDYLLACFDTDVNESLDNSTFFSILSQNMSGYLLFVRVGFDDLVEVVEHIVVGSGCITNDKVSR